MLTFLEIVDEKFYQLLPEQQYNALTRTDDGEHNALYALVQHLANCNDADDKQQLSIKTSKLLLLLEKNRQLTPAQQYDILFPSRSSSSRNWDLLPLIIDQLDHSLQRNFVGLILSCLSADMCKEIYAQFQVEGCPFANHRAAYFLSFLLFGMAPEQHKLLLTDTRLAQPLRLLIACYPNPAPLKVILAFVSEMMSAEKMQLFINSNILNHFDNIRDNDLKAYILEQLNDDPEQCCELFTQSRALGNFLLAINFQQVLSPEKIQSMLGSLRTLSLKQRNQVLGHLKDYIDSVDPAAARNVLLQFMRHDDLLFPSKSKSPNEQLMAAIINHCLNSQLNLGPVDHSAWKIDLYKEQLELALWLSEFSERCHRLSGDTETYAEKQLHERLQQLFFNYLCSEDPIAMLSTFQSTWHEAIKNAPSILSASQGWGEFVLKGFICVTAIGLLILACLEIRAKQAEERKDLSLAGINTPVPNRNWFFPHVHLFKSDNEKVLQAMDKQVDELVAVQKSFLPTGM